MLLKKENGVTLIALAVTIIVLLIISGITLGTLQNKDSIVKQAKDTGASAGKESIIEKIEADLYQEKAKTGKVPTKAEMKKLIQNKGYNKGTLGNDSFITKDGEYTIKYSEIVGWEDSVEPGQVVSETKKDNYTDDNGDTATIPEGFTVSKIKEEQKVSEGLVIYDIPKSDIAAVDWTTKNADGAYNVQTLYNQFVWIPVEDEATYQKNFNYPSYYDNDIENTPTNSTFTDTGYLPLNIQPSTDNAENNEIEERKATLKYNGFYIARYEAGKDNSNVVSKQNATVYVSETQTNFKSIGKTMYGESSTYVKSAMCSGIQWDMVMDFVDRKQDGNGKIYDVRTYNSTRHTGSQAKSGKNLSDKVQNIYDLEGNCFEYIAEKNNTSFHFVRRGGYCGSDSSYGSNRASERDSSSGDANSGTTFRLVLYIK